MEKSAAMEACDSILSLAGLDVLSYARERCESVPEQLLRTSQVQEILQVGTTTFCQQIGPQLPRLRVGREYRYPRAGIDEWVRKKAKVQK